MLDKKTVAEIGCRGRWLRVCYLNGTMTTPAINGRSQTKPTAELGYRWWLYCPVASRYLATISAGTRPRSLTSMPWPLAQARTAVVSMAVG